MTGRTSKRPNVRMSIYAAMGGTNRREPAGLALPALPALEPSPWDEEPFRPERVLPKENAPSLARGADKK